MSFEQADVESRDLTDLTNTQVTTLNDWDKRFREKYPVVGRLIDGDDDGDGNGSGSTEMESSPPKE